jgi:tetratricopeptide (TPR) repeat protein
MTSRSGSVARRVALNGAAIAVALALGACGPSTPQPQDQSNPSLDGDSASSGGGGPQAAPASSQKVKQGMELLQSSKFQAAKAVLSAAHQEDPKDPQAAYYLGVAHEGLQDFDGAAEFYKKALDLDPKLSEAAVNLSAVLLDKDDVSGALQVIDKGLKTAPKHPQLLANRAVVLQAQGDPGAVDAFAAAVAASPDDASLRFSYAEVLARSKKRDDAVAQLRQIVDKSDDAVMLSAVATMYGRLKAFSDCVLASDKSIKIKPSPDAYVRRGVCRHDLDDNAGAKADYEAALKIDPSFAPGHYYLGMQLRQDGKKKEALVHLDKAAELGEGDIAARAKEAAQELRRKK